MKSRYNAGERALLRRVVDGQICRVTTTTVVQDTPDLIALYWGPGYPIKSRRNFLSVTASIHTDLKDGSWGGTEILMLASPEAAHAVYAWWSEDDRKFLSWYINLQSPLRRTSVGFDITDYLLDITASPDRTEWSWKDEEDFEQAILAGNISTELAEAIRLEGEKAIKLLQEGPSSYYEAWMKWSPSEEWKIPEMPLNWDKK